jgi:hypothetical protein
VPVPPVIWPVPPVAFVGLLPAPPVVLVGLVLLPAVLPVGLVPVPPDPPAPSKLLPGLEQPSDAKLAMTAASETVRAVSAGRQGRWVMCKSLIGEVGPPQWKGPSFVFSM